MTIRAATPYLILHGRAREALAFYERALGAKVEGVMRFGDVDQSCAEAQKDLVMHASMHVGEALMMMSDGPGSPAPSGPSTVNVALDLETETELRAAFDALADGGTPIEPPLDAPWGAVFAAVVDRFGISWMLNSTKPAGGASA